MRRQWGKTFVEIVVGLCIGAIILASAGGYKYAQAQFTPGPNQGGSFNAAIPGPIGGTTPSTAQFTGLSGVTTSVVPCTGCIGELLRVTIPSTSAVTATSGNAMNISAVFVTAGTWMCEGTTEYIFSAATSITNLQTGLTTTSGTLPATELRGIYSTAANVPNLFINVGVPRQQITTGGISAVYMVAQSTFSIAAQQQAGTIACQRTN